MTILSVVPSSLLLIEARDTHFERTSTLFFSARQSPARILSGGILFFLTFCGICAINVHKQEKICNLFLKNFVAKC